MSVDWSSVWEGGGRTGMERVEEERDAARAEAARLRERVGELAAERNRLKDRGDEVCLRVTNLMRAWADTDGEAVVSHVVALRAALERWPRTDEDDATLWDVLALARPVLERIVLMGYPGATEAREALAALERLEEER